jgi:hypothetical protein
MLCLYLSDLYEADFLNIIQPTSGTPPILAAQALSICFLFSVAGNIQKPKSIVLIIKPSLDDEKLFSIISLLLHTSRNVKHHESRSQS